MKKFDEMKQYAKDHKKQIGIAGAIGAAIVGSLLIGSGCKKKPSVGTFYIKANPGPKTFGEVVDEQVFVELAPTIEDLILGNGGTIEQTFINEATGKIDKTVKVTVK